MVCKLFTKKTMDIWETSGKLVVYVKTVIAVVKILKLGLSYLLIIL